MDREQWQDLEEQCTEWESQARIKGKDDAMSQAEVNSFLDDFQEQKNFSLTKYALQLTDQNIVYDRWERAEARVRRELRSSKIRYDKEKENGRERLIGVGISSFFSNLFALFGKMLGR